MTDRAVDLWTVVLAAGGSTRLGRPKQLLRLRARPLIKRTVDLAASLTPGRVVVVVGAFPHRMRAAVRSCPRPLRIVANPRWREGMSGSLRRGLEALPPGASAALLLTVDQPLVARDDLARLVAAWSRHPRRPAAAAYEGRLGVPAVLPRRHWRRASAAGGDAGARAVLRRPDLRITAVDIPAAALDLDTPEDVARLSAPHAREPSP